MPARAADAFTTYQITFSVMPSLQTDLFLLTQRKIRPSLIDADATQRSIADFTQFGTGTVRIWAALPTTSTMTQCSSLC